MQGAWAVRAKNLVVVAHPDDEVLGFGATGAKIARQGGTVASCILCGAAKARSQRPNDTSLRSSILAASEKLGFLPPILGDFPNIQMNTVPHLDLVRFIESAIDETGAEYIYTHHYADLNNDHEQVSKACLAAARLFQRRAGIAPLKRLSFMEVLSSTDWSFADGGRQFDANTYSDIGDRGVEIKLAALSCYESVMRDFPHPRSKEVIRSLAAYRGAQAGVEYAEAFQTVFSVI